MKDIFTDKTIYPHEGKIKNHFSSFYDSVFIAFLPFIRIDKQAAEDNIGQETKQIFFEKSNEWPDIVEDDRPSKAHISSSSNNDYPTDQIIFESGVVISWDAIINGSGLKDNSELHKALRTSIGALRPIFRRPELLDKLNTFTKSQNISHPTEGGFDILSKVAIYKVFKLLGKDDIVITDEVYATTSVLELDKLTEFEFSGKVSYKDYYLYSVDKEVLFTIEWDSFFFLIGTDSNKMARINQQNLFEGFLCDEKTLHTWDYEEGEIQKFLLLEEQQKVLK